MFFWSGNCLNLVFLWTPFPAGILGVLLTPDPPPYRKPGSPTGLGVPWSPRVQSVGEGLQGPLALRSGGSGPTDPEAEGPARASFHAKLQ